jgi:hypothetical protein
MGDKHVFNFLLIILYEITWGTSMCLISFWLFMWNHTRDRVFNFFLIIYVKSHGDRVFNFLLIILCEIIWGTVCLASFWLFMWNHMGTMCLISFWLFMWNHMGTVCLVFFWLFMWNHMGIVCLVSFWLFMWNHMRDRVFSFLLIIYVKSHAGPCV